MKAVIVGLGKESMFMKGSCGGGGRPERGRTVEKREKSVMKECSCGEGG